MIYGVGIDIIEVSRIKKEVTDDDSRFAERIYTKGEMEYCESQPSKALNYAARFAAKEAFFKAMGSGWSGGYSWQDIEVGRYPEGRPYIITHGKVKSFLESHKITGIHVSLSHVADTATAVVILETGSR
ncbi:MAG: holo-ACP synthase [Oligoflexia bacterium]|nr:holo-ACP synthase [Oligoflexia bacterium]